MMPTPPLTFTTFCFSYLSWIGYESLHCRSSYAPAMSPYIYLMTHILLIASSSIPASPPCAPSHRYMYHDQSQSKPCSAMPSQVVK